MRSFRLLDANHRTRAHTVILAFINLLFCTLTFFSVANQLKSVDKGDYGAGV